MNQRSSQIHETQKLRNTGQEDMPRTCKRVVVHQYGGPDSLEVVEGPIPEPVPGEARVRTLVAGVSFQDIMHRRGIAAPKAPFTPGYDIVGMVDKLGEDVSGLEVGQTVAALMPQLGQGAYADFVCLGAQRLVQVPKGIDLAEAACMVLNYTVAWQMLQMVQARDGHKILVHGAAGGVGTALLDLARLRGCTSIGCASGEKAETIASYGARPIDYRSDDVVDRVRSLTGDGVDFVFDPIGGDHVEQSLQALRLDGCIVCYGVLDAVRSGRVSSNPLDWFRRFKLKAFSGDKTIREYRLGSAEFPVDRCRDDLLHLFTLLQQKKISPLIARRVPLNKVAFAHGLVENAEVEGTVALICNV